MDNYRRQKTLKIRLSVNEPNSVKNLQTSKKTIQPKKKTIRIATRVNEREIIDKSLEKDFEIEKDDPLAFFKERKGHYEEMGYVKFGGSRNIKTLETPQTKSEIQSPIFIKPKKKMTIKHALFDLIDNEIQIISTIGNINKRIEEGKVIAKEKLKHLEPRDKLAYLKQEKSLSRFKNTLKKWNIIESGLTKKAKKSSEELISNKHKTINFDEPAKLPDWYITLRQDPNREKFESFIPIGNRLSGLYSRDVFTVNSCRHAKAQSCPDLKILGSSKLPLEITALKKTKARIDKKVKIENVKEEIYVENYDFTNKFYKL